MRTETSSAPPRASAARRSRGRALVSLAIALSSGLCATWLIARTLARHAPPSSSVPMRKVAVINKDLPPATVLHAEAVDLVDWPASAVPVGAIGDPQALEGRVLRSAMVPGEPVLESRLAPVGGGVGLAAVIPESLRAMTVKVNESTGVAGFIHPGDRVDVIATMAPRQDITEMRSRVVLQRLRVVAVGEELSSDPSRPAKVPVVTLLVTPEQAERLALATIQGQLHLAMRSTSDEAEPGTPGVSPPDLYEMRRAQTPDPRPFRRERDAPVAVAASVPASSSEVVEIIRGNRTEERKLRNSALASEAH